MNFFDYLGTSFLFYFLSIFTLLVVVFFLRWNIIKWIIALILGEIFTFLLIASFLMEPYQTNSLVDALVKLNLTLIVLLVGIYFYSKRRRVKRRE